MGKTGGVKAGHGNNIVRAGRRYRPSDHQSARIG
jgi:hypothetical protein